MTNKLTKFLIAAALAVTLSYPVAAQQAQTEQPQGDLRDLINNGTVGIISGGVTGTYIRIAADLAAVLDDGYDLRILPIIGKGSLQNIADILYLKGVDVGIVQSDVLAYVKREAIHGNVDQRIHYITKLYNEELHILGGPGIDGIEDLAGKKVNFGVEGSGTHMTATIVFDGMGVEVEPTGYDQALALEKVKSGELAGMVYVVGKPAQLFQEISAQDGLRLLPLPYTPELLETYLPSAFSNDDYPQLIPDGQRVDTLAVGAVMAVYNWDSESWRHEKVSRFIDAFLNRFDEFQQPPRHPKWREVSLSADVPGWTRFGPAQQWLDQTKVAVQSAERLEADFQAFLQEQPEAVVRSAAADDSQRNALFEQFLIWQKSRVE